MRHRIGFLILICAFILSPNLVSAQTGLTDGIGVDIVKPHNQINKLQTYFDLDITKNINEQDLIVYFDNHEKHEMELSIKVTNAFTNMNNEIDYHPNNNRGGTMKYGLTDLIQDYPKKIKVPKQSRTPITFHLNKPYDLDEGEILGGIYLENIMGDDSQEDMITNNFAYVKGVRLLNGKILKKIALNLTNARVINFQRQKVVVVNYENRNEKIIKDMRADVQIINKQTNEKFHSTVDRIDMAPNSNADLVVFKEADQLDAGEYLVKISNYYQDQQLDFELDLTVKNNKKVVKPDYTLIYVAGAIGLAIIVVVGTKLYRRKKNY